jgi:hypothetical protein
MSLGTYNMIKELNQFKTSLVYTEDGLFSREFSQAVVALSEKVLNFVVLFFCCVLYFFVQR